jgi:hypothetical protein
MMPTLTSLVVPDSIGAGSDAPGHAIFANALPPVQLSALAPPDGPGKAKRQNYVTKGLLNCPKDRLALLRFASLT